MLDAIVLQAFREGKPLRVVSFPFSDISDKCFKQIFLLSLKVMQHINQWILPHDKYFSLDHRYPKRTLVLGTAAPPWYNNKEW